MFAEVVINRRIPLKFDTFTYKIPEGFTPKPGQTVWVPFKNQKIAGVISDVSERQPDYPVKDIFGPIIENPLLSAWQIELAKFISRCYFCPISKVLPIFLPKKIWDNKPLKTKKTPVPTAPPRLNKKIVQQKARVVQQELQFEATKYLSEIQAGGKNLIHCVKRLKRLEIYSGLINEIARDDSQILIILPEIMLASRFLEYFQVYLKNPVSIFHSKLKESEKNSLWLSVHKNESNIIIGSKKALFLPFQNLKLIIVEEEENPSYEEKQTPHYQIKKVAEKIAELNDATLVLGSQSPSIETYNEAENGKYNLIEVTEQDLAKVSVVDLRDERKKGNFGVLSEKLKESIAKTLAQKKKIILFINRKGLAPAIFCRDCGYVDHCNNCKIPFALVKQEKFYAVCKKCSFKKEPKNLCPSCKSAKFSGAGIGVQKVEEEVKKIFAAAKILIIEKDAISKKDFLKKRMNADIFIGTQMILNIPIKNVGLVGIILIDLNMNIPEKRALEETFRLLMRFQDYLNSKGEMVIQAYNKENYVLDAALKNDYKFFYRNELRLRSQ